MNCPKCKTGKLYPMRDGESDSKDRMCYRCGYYEADNSAFKEDPKFWQKLIKEGFSGQVEWHPSPIVGRPFTSPEHWTEPTPEFLTLNRKIDRGVL